MQQNYRYKLHLFIINEKPLFNPLKKKLANNIQILFHA